MADASFRPPKQWKLTENESITSFANWKSNILYHVSLNNDFAQFLASDWSKQSVADRGLLAADDKTPVQRNIILERMLGLIAQFAPSLLRNDIIKKSTSLSYIWQRIRKHYSFSQSEVNFLKLSGIKREENERYETYFQRIMAHLEDNLLTVASGLTHDGAVLTADEEMSPSTERLAVYLWLTSIDERLPAHVARVYAHDLHIKTLKDLQPQLADTMDNLLADLSVQEDISINYSSTRKQHYKYNDRFNNNKRNSGGNRSYVSAPSADNKSCVLCKTAGRRHEGHNISGCWFISKFDKLQMMKALCVEVDSDDIEQFSEPKDMDAKQVSTDSHIQKVHCDVSPYFHAFHDHHSARIVLDTGATSSLISKSFVTSAGIRIQPTKHSARAVDRSSLIIHGEVHITLTFSSVSLPITALVVDTLDCDILAGVPFCKNNDIQVHLKDEHISIGSIKIPYGSKPNSSVQDIYRTESFILHSNSSKVILPGEFLEYSSDDLKEFDGEVSIEPHISSPLQGTWPEPEISCVIDGTVRIPNNTDCPVTINRSQHFARIRRVLTPATAIIEDTSGPPTYLKPKCIDKDSSFSSAVSLNPDGLLSDEECEQFRSLNIEYDNVFNPQFEAYNDYSGTIRAKVNIGPVKPPPQKGKLPFYTQANLHQLQEKADELEALGILVRPEDVGVDVEYVSPSFLVNKPLGGQRLVTAFNNLSQYTRILPTSSTSCNEVLRKLSSWKYVIKSDLTKSFFQIRVAKSSMKYLGTVTPFKGLRVYARTANGMPGASEYLQELMSRVFGDFMQEGWLIMIADDIYICANSVFNLIHSWARLLQRAARNNISLSASKTCICPLETTILGWKWKAGTLTPCEHKTSPLITVSPPSTCTSMRSFIGAFKALSKCIPRYASLVAPLEDAIKGLQGQQKIQWTDDLHVHFSQCQAALKSPTTITIPTPNDKLVLTVDASPLNKGLGATLFVIRNDKRYIGGFFSFKLKSHQVSWLPCELEGLAITAAVNFFSPFIRESKHPLQVLTDSKPCVEAFKKMGKGHFSASNRISTFLSTLSTYKVTLCHLKGTSNQSSDYASRNPKVCEQGSCQICKFVEDTIESVVNAITVKDILSGSARMPFLNPTAWHSAQQECTQLRATFTHLKQGTRPPRKARNKKEVQRYLQVATIAHNGLLVVQKTDPYVHQRKLIIVPSSIVPGLLMALHLQCNHPTGHQLQQVFNRYFFALNSSSAIRNITQQCSMCESLKFVPDEFHTQTSSPSPLSPGSQFSTDVLRRTKQKIMVSRDVFSSYTTALIIPDETADTLRSGIVTTTALLRMPTSEIHVDGATGFRTLLNDAALKKKGITLNIGHVKNKNKNPVIDKGIRELEQELIRTEHDGSPVTQFSLDAALQTLNSRIRARGLSAKEIIFQRDQQSGEHLHFNDKELAHAQQLNRQQNHLHSATSKAQGGPVAMSANVNVGDLVFIKEEGSKVKNQEQYVITRIANNYAFLQKMNSGKFMSRQYEVPLTRIYPVVYRPPTDYCDWDNSGLRDTYSSDSDTDDSIYYDRANYNNDENVANGENVDNSENDDSDEMDGNDPLYFNLDNNDVDRENVRVDLQQRPQRVRNKPAYLADYDVRSVIN